MNKEPSRKLSLSQPQINLGLELIRYLEYLPDAHPFLEPVDYLGLGLHDYPLIITQPMDLSTARRKLIAGRYAKLDDFTADLHLIWSNCKTYNLEGSEIFLMAAKMETSMNHYYLKLMARLQETNTSTEIINFAEKVDFANKIKKVSSAVLKEIIDIIQKQCNEAYAEPRSDKLQLKVDLLDRPTFSRCQA